MVLKREREDLKPAGGRQMEHGQLCELDPRRKAFRGKLKCLVSFEDEEMFNLHAFYKTMNDGDPYIVT